MHSFVAIQSYRSLRKVRAKLNQKYGTFETVPPIHRRPNEDDAATHVNNFFTLIMANTRLRSAPEVINPLVVNVYRPHQPLSIAL